MNVEKFDWTEELHQTMVKSLVTSFGLDFLLLNDRKGGDVDTIHNVRNGIYATEAERQRYEGRGDYDSHHYHSHENYIATNRKGKRAHQAGTLTDAYTGEVFASDDNKNLEKYATTDSPEYQKMVQNIADRFGLSSLKFNTLETLIEAIGLPKCKVCTHCFDGSSCF